MNQPLTGVPQMLPAQVIDTSTDSREILKHARLAARRRKLHDWFVVDVDALGGVAGRYLVAADGDTILTCGLSGESSPELAALYQEAFSRQ